MLRSVFLQSKFVPVWYGRLAKLSLPVAVKVVKTGCRELRQAAEIRQLPQLRAVPLVMQREIGVTGYTAIVMKRVSTLDAFRWDDDAWAPVLSETSCLALLRALAEVRAWAACGPVFPPCVSHRF